MQLFDMILHVDKMLDAVIRQYGILVYFVLFAIIFCETAFVVFPFLPGDSLLFIAGTFSATGALNIGIIIVLFIVASVLGNTVNYWIGSLIGHKILAKNYSWLEKHGIEIEAVSFIRTLPVITKLDHYILKNVDWVFFSSKNAVEYFFQLEPLLPKKAKFGVMGSGSEDTLRRLGHIADFTGEGIDPAHVAAEFAKLADGKTVLFPAAENSLKSIQHGLSADTKIIDLPVYETVPLTNIETCCEEILVFTSPSNVEAYFAENLLEPDQKVIAIGKSTGKKLDEFNIKYTLPYSPDETGLAEAVFGI